jgi:hypothetical protein
MPKGGGRRIGGKLNGATPRRSGGSRQPGVPSVKMGPLKGNKGAVKAP